MNEMRWELNDVWPQWTCVKRRIGAANCSKKLIKSREFETLPAGSGGTGNVPTVSGSWATNGAWTLGWVSSRICTGDRRQQEVINWWDGRVKRICSVSCENRPQRERISVPNQVKLVILYWQVRSTVTRINATLFSQFNFSGEPHVTWRKPKI